jgi:hypothetical protein
MRDALLFLGGRTRGQDAQLAVHLHRVGVDDGAADAFGDGQRQGGFAAGGWAGDQQGRWIVDGFLVGRCGRHRVSFWLAVV